MKPSTLRRHGSILPGGGSIVLPAFHQASRSGRSIFPSRVYAPDEVGRVLKTGHQSRKIGKTVMKGVRRGWPIFTLTLEERASCPAPAPGGAGCREWASCYGNNMQAAERIEHGPALIAALEDEIAALAALHPGGFMVRLHVLGDFWSVDYVRFWGAMLRQWPMCALFGFTAHAPASPIGHAISLQALDFGWSRAAIRFSGAPHELHAARVIGPGEIDGQAILCPAQRIRENGTPLTECCATCALCWQSPRSIAFRRH